MKWPWRHGPKNTAGPDVGDPDLTVVAQGVDEAMASSTALADSGFVETAPVVLRQSFWLPAAEIDRVAARFAADGYLPDPTASRLPDRDDFCHLTLARVMIVDAVALSRERSRAGSAVSRAGGRVAGWAILARGDAPMTAR